MAEKTFDELTEPQQRACYAFAGKYFVTKETVARRLDDFFRLANGEIDFDEMERRTGLKLRDQLTGSLFG